MKTILLSALVVFLCVASSQARVRRIPMEDMASQADFVIIGEVLDSDAHWDEKGVMINTDYVVGVKENILGKTEPVIFMTFAGGTVNGESVVVSESPRLEVGKTYLLFGLENGKSYAPVVGRGQGIFEIREDAASGKDYFVDYFGSLLESLGDGRVVRGRPVDSSVKDRLVIMEPKAAKGASVPEPIVRDAQGNIVPQPKHVSVKKAVAGRSGRPLEKGEFINYIIGRAKK